MPDHRRHAADVTRADLGDDWPLTVESGTIYFEDEAVLFKARGTLYALNGTAKARGYVPVDDIWETHPDYAPNKRTIGPLIALGRRLAYPDA